MERRPDTIAARARGAAIACGLALALAVLMTWPLASGLGRLGRTTNMDGLYGIWNVGWVSRARSSATRHRSSTPTSSILTARRSPTPRPISSPASLGFRPGSSRTTRTPPITARCSLRSRRRFSGRGCWRGMLSDARDTPIVAAILFAFCPYFYSHSAHVQLLMAGGIPLSMLALHQLVDAAVAEARCRAGRRTRDAGTRLRLLRHLCRADGWLRRTVLALRRRLCGAIARSGSPSALGALVAAAYRGSVSSALSGAAAEGGFVRSLDDARRYSATWQSYLASPSHLHRPILALARQLGWRMGEVLFPGVLVIVLGILGVCIGWTRDLQTHAPDVTIERR